MTLSRRTFFALSGGSVALASSLFGDGVAQDNPAAPASKNLLHPVQQLDTSGARAVVAFEADGANFLAIPQLAEDIDGRPANMNGGDSDISLIVYRHQDDKFVEHQRLPVSGGEDAEFFRIGDRAFLATASIRSGHDPYSFDVASTIFEWRQGRFEAFQKIPTFAAKQWRHFTIGERNFLALAQGITLPGITSQHPINSTIFEWDGAAFKEFQVIPSAWGYNWHYFSMRGDHYLAYADHVLPSVVLRWTGKGFEPFQTFAGKGGRAFRYFEAESQAFLVFASILEKTVLYRWSDGKFVEHQTLSGPGGRELCALDHRGKSYLIQINFITGTPANPTTAQRSVIYEFQSGQFKTVETFPTLGATDAAVFNIADDVFVAVTESLTESVRFRTPSRIYRFGAA